MKKQFSMLALTLALVLVLTSCIPNPNPSQSGSTSTSETVVEYTVSFDLNGGIAGEDFVESLTVKHGETIALPTPTMENFTFVGWFDGEELYTEETPITKNVTLRAEWEAGNTYEIAFDTNGIADVPAIYPEIDALPTIPAAPQVEGYVFAGWYFDAGYTTRYFFDYPLNEATTLYAKFYDTTLGEYIVISNVEQLMAIKDDPASKYLLARDINCKGETLTPIDEFSGEIEGNGYRILNFSLSEDAHQLGFIRTNNGAIKNLTFDDFTFDVLLDGGGESFYGVVCCINNGLVENCHTSNGEIKINCSVYASNRYVYAGGIVGKNSGTITKCTNNASFVTHFSASGFITWKVYNGYIYPLIAGICGDMTEGATLTDCTNFANISIEGLRNSYGVPHIYAGGIVSRNKGTIENGENLGNIDLIMSTTSAVYYCVGGAVAVNQGDASNIYAQCNINISGNATGNSCLLGGFSGYNSGEIRDCYSVADITNTCVEAKAIGGFLGYNSGKVYNCYSVIDMKGNLTSVNSVGGFVGINELLSGNEAIINKCFTMGSIELAGVPVNSGNIVGLSTGSIRDSYYVDTFAINKVTSTQDENGEVTEIVEAIELTNTEGNAKTESDLLSVNFIENTLYFDRMIWFLVDGELPKLR